ncbi:MAG: carboxypeptidase-like regulatory domain-containing protein, partial [Chitinophagales bacterium]|nr:carboxypeptidase-like regulatory domain-containing protein [Chitinophagales bacterium]
MNRIPFYLLLSLFPFISFAQNAVLKGKIVDDNNEALLGVNVIVDVEKSLATISDFDGLYSLSLPAGKYLVKYTYISKLSVEKEIKLNAGETRSIN